MAVLVAQELDDFPDFVRRELIAKRSHDSSGASFGDGVEDHRIGRLVNPLIIGQIGANRAFGFVTVTGIASSFQEQPFALDRGGGFDPQSVPTERQGVRNSILDRMSRHGGTAEIRSTPETGTEVRLKLPRHESARQENSR